MRDTAVDRFPFGRAVAECGPHITEPRPWLILGAYPSALHVAWTPPRGYRPVQALAVDNEPEVFWDGSDESARVDAWQAAVAFRPEWGRIAGARRLNGSSGQWLNQHLLKPLAVERTNAWMTDCLTTYRASNDQAGRLADTYLPFAETYGLPIARLSRHPAMNEIMREALNSQRGRLRHELDQARPDRVLTLGDAALRIFRSLAEVPVDAPDSLRQSLDTGSYGRAWVARLSSGRAIEWLPLAHPASLPIYQAAHERWVESRPDGL